MRQSMRAAAPRDGLCFLKLPPHCQGQSLGCTMMCAARAAAMLGMAAGAIAQLPPALAGGAAVEGSGAGATAGAGSAAVAAGRGLAVIQNDPLIAVDASYCDQSWPAFAGATFSPTNYCPLPDDSSSNPSYGGSWLAYSAVQADKVRFDICESCNCNSRFNTPPLYAAGCYKSSTNSDRYYLIIRPSSLGDYWIAVGKPLDCSANSQCNTGLTCVSGKCSCPANKYLRIASNPQCQDCAAGRTSPVGSMSVNDCTSGTGGGGGSAAASPSRAAASNGIEAPTTCSSCISAGWQWCQPSGGACSDWGPFCSSASGCSGRSSYSMSNSCGASTCAASASPQPAASAASSSAGLSAGGIAGVAIGALVLIGAVAVLWARRTRPALLPKFLKPAGAVPVLGAVNPAHALGQGVVASAPAAAAAAAAAAAPAPAPQVGALWSAFGQPLRAAAARARARPAGLTRRCAH